MESNSHLHSSVSSMFNQLRVLHFWNLCLQLCLRIPMYLFYTIYLLSIFVSKIFYFSGVFFNQKGFLFKYVHHNFTLNSLPQKEIPTMVPCVTPVPRNFSFNGANFDPSINPQTQLLFQWTSCSWYVSQPSLSHGSFQEPVSHLRRCSTQLHPILDQPCLWLQLFPWFVHMCFGPCQCMLAQHIILLVCCRYQSFLRHPLLQGLQ